MKNFVEIMSSPAFWIATVLVGLVLNVASTYIVRTLDRRIFTFKIWRRGMAESLRERLKEMSRHIDANESAAALVLLESIGQRVTALTLHVFGVLGLAAAAFFMPDGIWNWRGSAIGAAGLALITYGLMFQRSAGILEDLIRSHPRGLAELIRIDAQR